MHSLSMHSIRDDWRDETCARGTCHQTSTNDTCARAIRYHSPTFNALPPFHLALPSKPLSLLSLWRWCRKTFAGCDVSVGTSARGRLTSLTARTTRLHGTAVSAALSCTLRSKKVVHQTHGDNFVNS